MAVIALSLASLKVSCSRSTRASSVALIQEGKMKFAPDQVVNLKSGGQPLTVVAVDGDGVECIWLGEEGDLFRESIPAVALELAFGDASADLDSADEREFANARAVANDDDDEEEDGDEEDEDDEEEEDDEDEEDEEEDEEDEENDEDEEEDEEEGEEDRAVDELREPPATAAARRRRVLA
jgi:uncharacterized protein YodC (DUF2158 family)